MSLPEKYRPRTLDDIVGQPKAVAQLRAWLASPSRNHALACTGPTGVGKSSALEVLAREFADEHFITRIVGRNVTAAVLRDIEHEICLYGWGKGGRVWIFNECHGLGKACIEILLDMLERLPKHVYFFFTTSRDGQLSFDEYSDGPAFLDRMKCIKFTEQGVAPAAAALLARIAQDEGLPGFTEKDGLKLMRECGCSIRRGIERLSDLIDAAAVPQGV